MRNPCTKCDGEGVVDRDDNWRERCHRCAGSGLEPPRQNIIVVDGADGLTPEMLRKRK